MQDWVCSLLNALLWWKSKTNWYHVWICDSIYYKMVLFRHTKKPIDDIVSLRAKWGPDSKVTNESPVISLQKKSLCAVCVCINIHTHSLAYKHTCMDTHTHTHTHTHMHTCGHTCTLSHRSHSHEEISHAFHFFPHFLWKHMWER